MTLSRDVKQQIVTLSQHTTKSKREIARDVGVSEGIVRLTLKTWDETGSLEKHGEGRSGCKPKMTNRDVRKLVIESKKDPKKSARDLQQCLADAGAGISLRTIQRNLLKGGRKVYRPIKTPIISKANVVKRLLWAQQMKDVTEEEWEKYIFSDETMIELTPPRAQYVRRSIGERVRPCHTDPRSAFPLKVMIWGCFSIRGLSALKVISGSMNCEEYMNTIDTHLIPQAAMWYPCGDWVFQQDNASCHTSKRTMEYLHSKNIDVMFWPANSADLNPIENLWALLKRRIRSMGACSKAELLTHISLISLDKDYWEPICRTLVHSMPHRVSAVIRAHGKSTKY